MIRPGDYGPKPGSDSAKTPVAPHSRPAPVVVRSGMAPMRPPPLPTMPRPATPPGGTLAPLGPKHVPVPGPEVYASEEPPTTSRTATAIAARLVRNWAACSVEDQRLIEALALRLRPSL